MKKLIYVFCILSFISNAQLDRSNAPKPGKAPEIKIANPEVLDLNNGLKIILSENHKQPKVSFNLVMSSDPILEGDKAGLSEMVGQLILSGTTKRTKDELDNEIDFIGASLFASSDNIYFSSLTKHMDKGLDLMLDVLHNASFPQAEFDRVKKQMESGLLSAKTDPSSMSNNAMVKSVFPNHPFGEVMTEESLMNITREDVVAYYKDRFIPAGSYLVIVGDITIDKVKEIATKHFENWSGGAPFKATYNKGVSPNQNRVIFVEKPGAVQSVINIAFPVDITPGHEDYIKLSVANKIFGGGGFGTRLMQNLREDKAWTYGAYSSVNVNKEGSWFTASGNFRNEVTDSAIYEFIEEIKNITSEFVTDEELTLNKASMAGSFARSLESPRTIANFALNTFENNLPADYYQTYLQKLDAVSKEDILNVAKKYISPNQLNIIVVGNKEVLDKIKRYDADGEIEQLDAYGNPYVEKTYAETSMKKEDVLSNYLMAISATSSLSKARKKISKIKSVEQIMTIKPEGAPIELTYTSYFQAPNMSSSFLEVMGMTVQQEVFDGMKGGSKTMNQMGGQDEKELSAEEIAVKKKMHALFPELGLIENVVDYNLLGIDTKNGTEYYVIEFELAKSKSIDYYNTSSFMKEFSETMEVTEEGPQNSTINYLDFQSVKGILFPHQLNQSAGGAMLEAKMKEIKVNGKIDPVKFSLK